MHSIFKISQQEIKFQLNSNKIFKIYKNKKLLKWIELILYLFLFVVAEEEKQNYTFL